MDRPTEGVKRLALRSPTLPPATHTNCYLVGDKQLTAIDPASPWEDEQGRLLEALDGLEREGEVLERILLTHHHMDHVSGAMALRDAYRERGRSIPIVAHPVTADLLSDVVEIDGFVHHGDTLMCGGVEANIHHTPGHAPGHVVLELEAGDAIVAGDMVAGVGTILIAPHEGDLGDYIASLEAMMALGRRMLLPAHGDPLEPAETVLSFYIAHRHSRTEQIRTTLETHGALTPAGIVSHVYAEVDRRAWPIAEVQVQAHLDWMQTHGLARPADEGRWRTA